MNFKRPGSFVVVTLLGTVLFIPFLGGVHLFDWDEINFAEAAREMLVTGNYARVQIDFHPFWEKPPLFFWLQVASMKLFGVNEFAARFPNAICGILTFCLIFYLGKKYFSAAFGWLWVLVYAGSFLPHFYFKSGIIDPWFNLFIFTAIVFLSAASRQQDASWKLFALSGIAVGLAVLTKGPVALLVVVITAVIVSFNAGRKWLSFKAVLVFCVAIILAPGIWLAIDYFQNGTFFIKEFIHYQVQLFRTGVAGHGGPFYYHTLVLLLGCFPASVFALSGFFNKHSADEKQLHFRLWMIVLFLVVLVLFSIVKTKIVHYSSLCYLPLTFLAAWEIHYRIKHGLSFSKWQIVLLSVLGILIGIVVASIPFLARHPEFILPYITDTFVRANLEAEVNWPFYLISFGFIYWLVMLVAIFRMGKGQIQRAVIKIFISSGVLAAVLLITYVPRVERYTQGAAIDFYKTWQGKDVYVEVLGFKSYAHLFYRAKQRPTNPDSYDKDWLLEGGIDKPAYFVCKINKADEYKAYPQMEEVGRKNGFVFLKRDMNR